MHNRNKHKKVQLSMCKVHKLPNNYKGLFKKKDLQSSGFQKARGPPGGARGIKGISETP